MCLYILSKISSMIFGTEARAHLDSLRLWRHYEVTFRRGSFDVDCPAQFFRDLFFKRHFCICPSCHFYRQLFMVMRTVYWRARKCYCIRQNGVSALDLAGYAILPLYRPHTGVLNWPLKFMVTLRYSLLKCCFYSKTPLNKFRSIQLVPAPSQPESWDTTEKDDWLSFTVPIVHVNGIHPWMMNF